MAEPETTLPTPIPTSLNISALAKRFKVARSTIQRRLKKGWSPPTKVPRKPRKTAGPGVALATPSAAPSATPSATPAPQQGRIVMPIFYSSRMGVCNNPLILLRSRGRWR
jgi:hypothetical protein